MADFRDALNAYGAKNDPAMARSTNANQYADLPNPRRAAEIVAEARQRVAASGGNPQHLQAMIQRVSDEFAQRDQMNQPSDGGGYQQPNNIDAYIDRVLQMSGMTGRPSASTRSQASGSDNSEYAAPVDEVERGGPLPDAAPNPDNEAGGDNSGWGTLGMMAAGVLAAAGTAGLVAWLHKVRAEVPDSGITDADIANAERGIVPGGNSNVSSAPRTAVDESIDAIDGAHPKQARLPAPEARLSDGSPTNVRGLPNPADGEWPAGTEAWSDTDKSIANTMSQDDIDQVFQDRVEGRAGSEAMPGPNRFAGDTPLPDDIPAEVIEQATQRAQSGDIRGAVTMLREHGVELDDNLLRQLVEGSNVFKSLQQRAGEVAGDAVGSAVRKGVRGAL